MKFHLIFLTSIISLCNYRPISLLPNIEKISQKLVYNRITTFLNNNNLICPLNFGFRHNYSTNHTLINLTEDIRKNLDEGKVECGIFVDLQKDFNTVDHNILLAKLEHYGARAVTNDWFKSYLSDRRQFVFINGFNSDYAMLIHGVSQGSVLGPIIFLIYINDLNHAVKYCKVHHFADDTNLLHINTSARKLNRLLSLDMKYLSVWLNANKISLYVQKTKLAIFKQKRKILDHKIKLKLNRKRLYPAPSVKCQGVKIDENLNWHHHINDLAAKLNRTNALLFKVRN